MTRSHDTLTGDLFKVPQPVLPQPAGLEFRAQTAALVSQVLKEVDADRYEIAARMSRLTGREISKYMLDAYSSEAREEFNLPLWLVPALEVSCQTLVFSEWLVRVRGGQLLIGRETLTAELGRLERQKINVDKSIRDIKKRMGS